jgi:hypothetical protein
MKSDRELLIEGYENLSKALGLVDMERFISLVKRGNFDYTEWQRNLWQNETIESLTEKAQKNWEKKYGRPDTGSV